MTHEFEYALGSKIKIKSSGEKGEVIGRAQHRGAPDSYYIHYRAADGRAVSAWWARDLISASPCSS